MITNPQKLIKKLEKLPDEIYEQEKKTLEAKEALEMKKIELDVKQADAMLKAQKPNASEKKAQALIDTQETRKEVLKSSLEYERQNAYLTALNNQFTALRKVSSIETELLKANL